MNEYPSKKYAISRAVWFHHCILSVLVVLSRKKILNYCSLREKCSWKYASGNQFGIHVQYQSSLVMLFKLGNHIWC